MSQPPGPYAVVGAARARSLWFTVPRTLCCPQGHKCHRSDLCVCGGLPLQTCGTAGTWGVCFGFQDPGFSWNSLVHLDCAAPLAGPQVQVAACALTRACVAFMLARLAMAP